MAARNRAFIFLGQIIERLFQHDARFAANSLQVRVFGIEKFFKPRRFRQCAFHPHPAIKRPAGQFNKLTSLIRLQPTPTEFFTPRSVVSCDDGMPELLAHTVKHIDDPLDMRFIDAT